MCVQVYSVLGTFKGFCQFGDFESRQIDGLNFTANFAIWRRLAFWSVNSGQIANIRRFGHFKSQTRTRLIMTKNRQILMIFDHLRLQEPGARLVITFWSKLVDFENRPILAFWPGCGLRRRKSRLLKSHDFRPIRVGMSGGACGRRRFQNLKLFKVLKILIFEKFSRNF